jgi:hypothetical protein
MHKLATLLIGVALSVLASCAHQVPAGPTGWVVAGISKDEAYGTVELIMRPVGSTSGTRILGFNVMNALSKDMQYEGKTALLADAAQFTPGKYEIVNFRLHHTPMNFDFKSRSDFAVPFEVKEGEVTYLGNFTATGTYYTPIIVSPAIKNPYFLVSDQQSRDVALAAKANPGIAGKPVTNAAMVRVAPARGAPFFRTTKLPQTGN